MKGIILNKVELVILGVFIAIGGAFALTLEYSICEEIMYGYSSIGWGEFAWALLSSSVVTAYVLCKKTHPVEINDDKDVFEAS